MFVQLAPPKQHEIVEDLFGLAPIQLCMCGLITHASNQWAYPGIVLLTVFDGN